MRDLITRLDNHNIGPTCAWTPTGCMVQKCCCGCRDLRLLRLELRDFGDRHSRYVKVTKQCDECGTIPGVWGDSEPLDYPSVEERVTALVCAAELPAGGRPPPMISRDPERIDAADAALDALAVDIAFRMLCPDFEGDLDVEIGPGWVRRT